MQQLLTMALALAAGLSALRAAGDDLAAAFGRIGQTIERSVTFDSEAGAFGAPRRQETGGGLGGG